MSMEWKLIENPKDRDVLTYVGVYVTRWQPKWGKPTVGFVETEKVEGVPALTTTEIAGRIRQYAEIMQFRCRDGETAAKMRAFADRIEAGSPTQTDVSLPYEDAFPQPAPEQGRVKGPEVPTSEDMVSRDNPRLRGLLTSEKAAEILLTYCMGWFQRGAGCPHFRKCEAKSGARKPPIEAKFCHALWQLAQGEGDET